MANDPTLLFVVGAAKAGTSWLYRYLYAHPDCHLRSIKELHFFNNLSEEDVAAQRLRIERMRDEKEQQFVEGDDGKLVSIGTRIADLGAWLDVLETEEPERQAAYLRYLAAGRGDERLIGDLTPAYALLSEETLREMAGLAEDVRFIYIMRDPVERLWSHVRMVLARKSPESDLNLQAARRFLWRVYRGAEPGITDRGDYAATVARLGSAVEPDKVLLAFTEEMFSASGMRRICEFLGISYVEPDLETRINTSPGLEAQDRQRSAMADYLAPQYDFIEQLFGRLPKAWQREPLKV